MNANEVIESYVTEVVLQLPRRQRNDVAFELRALLNEELQDKAEMVGRPADSDMAIELMNAFGRPEAVAARYRPSVTVIDPAHGQRFVRLTLIGLVVIWVLGALDILLQPAATQSGAGVLGAVGQWLLGVLVPSLWWPGMLVAFYGLDSCAQSRWPSMPAWKPRAGDRIQGGRVALGMAVVGIACGLFVLVDPRWVLDAFYPGRAAPAAYEALTYTEAFRQLQAPWVFFCVLLNSPLLVAVLVQGRWSKALRRLETVLALATCALLLWTVMGGPVFKAASSDQMTKVLLVLIVAFVLFDVGMKAYRRVTPAPN